MPEQRTISTRTILTANLPEAKISIRTEYVEEFQDCIDLTAFIAAENTVSNSVFVGQGFLGFIYDDAHPTNPSFLINDMGELIIMATNADDYEINENGELVYTCNE